MPRRSAPLIVLAAVSVGSLAFVPDWQGMWLLALSIYAGLIYFIFDAKPFLNGLFLKVGYHGLTVVFIYQVAVLSWAALG